MTPQPNLILLPGLMCDAALWDNVAPQLSNAATIHFGDLFRDDTIPEMARRVLADAPETFALAGFSMGGHIAREIALMAPQRVIKLALINTSALGSSEKTLRRNNFALKILSERPFTGLAPSSIRTALHPDRHDDRELTNHIQSMALRLGHKVFRNQMSLVRTDRHDRLSEILCPTLVISSDSDSVTDSSDTERLAAGIPNSRFEIIANCGHMTPLEQPDRLAALLLDWLTD